VHLKFAQSPCFSCPCWDVNKEYGRVTTSGKSLIPRFMQICLLAPDLLARDTTQVVTREHDAIYSCCLVKYERRDMELDIRRNFSIRYFIHSLWPGVYER
jgi:hypothetical protein